MRAMHNANSWAMWWLILIAAGTLAVLATALLRDHRAHQPRRLRDRHGAAVMPLPSYLVRLRFRLQRRVSSPVRGRCLVRGRVRDLPRKPTG